MVLLPHHVALSAASLLFHLLEIQGVGAQFYLFVRHIGQANRYVDGIRALSPLYRRYVCHICSFLPSSAVRMRVKKCACEGTIEEKTGKAEVTPR